MLILFRQHRQFFLWTLIGGLFIRLLFLVYFPAITDDSRIYADFANNWLQHGTYGQTQLGQVVPSDTRLPGYPAFLALIFRLFGVGNFWAVLAVQILFDLGTCLILADLARRTVSDRSARIAFVLAALCPFLANYAAAALTETLEIFFTVLALDCAVAGLDQLNVGRSSWRRFAGAGAAIAACILLRPDGGLALMAVGIYLLACFWKRLRGHQPVMPMVIAGAVLGLYAIAPLVPWTIRNFRTLHHFQPLTSRYATESDELTPRGFNRWVKTWIVDYTSVEEIYWNVPGDKIDPEQLPSRAFDNPTERDATLALIADYNTTNQITLDLDARFAQLAAQRIRAHSLRYYVVLPSLRIVDMWLRPRTELMPSDVRWWEFNDTPQGSILAVTFGLLNLAYVGAAGLALIARWSHVRYLGLFLIFLILRSVFLGTLENPESRYTLECYPIVMLLASSLWTPR